MIRLFAAALAAVSLTLPAFAQDSDAASEPRVLRITRCLPR